VEIEQEPVLRVTPTFRELLWAFLIIGLTAYSVMLQQLKTLVVGHKWLYFNYGNVAWVHSPL